MDVKLKNARSGFFGTPAGWIFCAFAVIALFFLIAEHRAHLGLLVPYLPIALLGACVVLHGYMHSMGGHSSDSSPERDERPNKHHH